MRRVVVMGAIALALGAAHAAQAACPSRFQAQAGRGDDVDVLGIAWDQALRSDCEPDARQFHLLWRIDRWKGREPEPANSDIWDASVTPFIRWPLKAGGMAFAIDAGIGLHALSHTEINAERKMSTAIQFGEFLGVSVPLDESAYELGVRLQHVSNGGIKHPNDGITYVAVVLSRTF
jgi:hypothetical protein